MDRQHRKLSVPPLLGRHDQGAEDHIVPKLDRKQGVDDQMPLSAREPPLGQHQEVNVGLGVVVAPSLGAENNDRNDGKALPKDLDRLGDRRSISWLKAPISSRVLIVPMPSYPEPGGPQVPAGGRARRTPRERRGAYQRRDSPCFSTQTVSPSSPRRCAWASRRRGGSSRGSSARSKVPQWMAMK